MPTLAHAFGVRLRHLRFLSRLTLFILRANCHGNFGQLKNLVPDQYFGPVGPILSEKKKGLEIASTGLIFSLRVMEEI